MRLASQTFSDLVQAIDAPGDQHQLVATMRQLPSDGLADTRRSAGDDGRSVFCRSGRTTRTDLTRLAGVAS